MEDPEEKTKFHREIAGKLCEFSEEVERENYLQAAADKYFIGVDNLRKLVTSQAVRTGLAKPAERPKSGVKSKADPEKKAKRAQGMLLGWLSEEPELYRHVKKYVSSRDFTVDLYRRTAERMFQDLEQGTKRNRCNAMLRIELTGGQRFAVFQRKLYRTDQLPLFNGRL